VARVVETAKAINISTDQRLLLVEPQEFVIDGQDVKEPIGMSGIRLEAKVHIVTGAQSAAENIIKCVRRCGLEVEQLMLNPLASSQAVLTDDERSWAWPGGHRRRHDRRGHLHQWRDPPYGGDSDCR
jgi:cell division protein FtsA